MLKYIILLETEFLKFGLISISMFIISLGSKLKDLHCTILILLVWHELLLSIDIFFIVIGKFPEFIIVIVLLNLSMPFISFSYIYSSISTI